MLRNFTTESERNFCLLLNIHIALGQSLPKVISIYNIRETTLIVRFLWFALICYNVPCHCQARSFCLCTMFSLCSGGDWKWENIAIYLVALVCVGDKALVPSLNPFPSSALTQSSAGKIWKSERGKKQMGKFVTDNGARVCECYV